MSIRKRFNVVLIIVLLPGLALSVLITRHLLVDNAKDEVLRNAGLMMETALSVRSYTIDRVKPVLDPLNLSEFLPETVPAFAATETFERLRKTHPEYSYKEATLNPTNLRDKASDWERAIIVDKFRKESKTELIGEKREGSGKSYLYIARPVRITNTACLSCHTSPELAPPSLVKKYGRSNGFGWHKDEVVGAQIVYVPADTALATANKTLGVVSGLFVVLMLFLLGVLNLMLDRIVIRPIRKVSTQSDQISLGNFNIPEFPEQGTVEIKQLHASFNRMRRSIEKAMQLLKTKGTLPGY